jgi:hypothetical protein
MRPGCRAETGEYRRAEPHVRGRQSFSRPLTAAQEGKRFDRSRPREQWVRHRALFSVIGNTFGLPAAIAAIGGVTFVSGLMVALTMPRR